MANVKPIKYDKPLNMRVDEDFLADLDDLRAASRPLLSRSDFIRKLVADAKAARGKARRK